MPVLILHIHPPMSMDLSGSEIWNNSTCIYTIPACLFSKLSEYLLVDARAINGAKGEFRIRHKVRNGPS